MYFIIEQSLVNLSLILVIITIILLIRHLNTFKFIILINIFTGIMIFIFLRLFLNNPISELLLMHVRIISISILYMLFYSEITPEDLMKALIYFKVPYQYSWTISSAFRYIFLLTNDSKEIKNALLIRGVPLDGNLFEKIINLPFITNLLLFRTNYLTMKFTEALFAKNWTPYGTKTFLYPLNIKQKSNVIIGLLLLIVVMNLLMTLMVKI